MSTITNPTPLAVSPSHPSLASSSENTSTNRIPLVRMVMGTCLRHYRNEGGWTLREVADLARVSPGYLSEIERGRKEVSSELIGSVCEALGIPVSKLLIDTGQRLATFEAIRATSMQEASKASYRLARLHVA